MVNKLNIVASHEPMSLVFQGMFNHFNPTVQSYMYIVTVLRISDMNPT